MLNQHRDVRLFTDPFNFAIYSDIFDDYTFSNIIKNYPSIDEMISVRNDEKYSKVCHLALGVNGFRFESWLSKGGKSLNISENFDDSVKQKFWSDFSEEVSSDFFCRRLIADLGWNPAGNEKFFGSVRLVSEIGAALIHPHVDKKSKIATIVFYVADQVFDNDKLGTSVYEKTLKTKVKGQLRDEVRIIYTAPFKQNSACGMLRSEIAIHGVEGHKCPTPRRSIHLYIHKT